jgi:hypothetical protein
MKLAEALLNAQGQAARHFRSDRALDALRGRILFRGWVRGERACAHRCRAGAGTFFPVHALVGVLIEENSSGSLPFDVRCGIVACIVLTIGL